MKVNELENKLRELNLLNVHVRGRIKEYIDGAKIYYDNEVHNCIDVFGIYKSSDGKYCFFITESERGGILDYLDICETEEEACDKLLDVMSRKERIYQKKHN